MMDLLYTIFDIICIVLLKVQIPNQANCLTKFCPAFFIVCPTCPETSPEHNIWSSRGLQKFAGVPMDRFDSSW